MRISVLLQCEDLLNAVLLWLLQWRMILVVISFKTTLWDAIELRVIRHETLSKASVSQAMPLNKYSIPSWDRVSLDLVNWFHDKLLLPQKLHQSCGHWQLHCKEFSRQFHRCAPALAFKTFKKCGNSIGDSCTRPENVRSSFVSGVRVQPMRYFHLKYRAMSWDQLLEAFRL